MIMMKHFRFFALTLFVLSLFALPAQAQTATTTTTLSAAITSTSATTVALTSMTNVAAGGAIYVDREQMTIASVNTTASTALVTRGNGGNATTHAVNALVFVATGPNVAFVFRNFDKYGTCTATAERFLPQINTVTGNVQTCNMWSTTVGWWGGTSLNQAVAYATIPITSITNRNYNATFTDVMIIYENFVGAGVAWKVTLPAANSVPGHSIIVKDGVGSAGQLYSIQILSSQNINGGVGSMTLTTNFQVRKLVSDGVAWWEW